MKSLTRLPIFLSWISFIKFALTLAFLASQMAVQAAPDQPNPPNSGSSEPVIVSTDKSKNPSKHRDLKRGPIQPEKYPTKPQQQIRNLR